MQRVAFANSRGLTLVGHLFAASTGKAIVMAHGYCGDKSQGGRFDRIAEALHDAGYAVLAFDFSGCGESDDDSLTVEKEVDDLRAAVRFVAAAGYRRIALFGHSLGSLICLRCVDPEVSTMVLTGAGTGPMQYNWADFYSAAQLQELRETGRLTDVVCTPWRERVVVDHAMLDAFERVDQQELLRQVTCPVLIIHGNRADDAEERALLEHSKRGLALLPVGSRLHVIDGADHRFAEHLDEVIRLAIDWYDEWL